MIDTLFALKTSERFERAYYILYPRLEPVPFCNHADAINDRNSKNYRVALTGRMVTEGFEKQVYFLGKQFRSVLTMKLRDCGVEHPKTEKWRIAFVQWL